MIIEETILKEIIKITFNKSLKFLSKFTDKQDTDQSFIKVQLENGLSIHINKALKFSENISIFRSPDNYDIAKNSIPLCLAKQDRRFSSIDSKEIIDEVDLLYDDSHHLLLGDPGAGKTTTLKRLTKRIFNILFCEKNNEYKYSFPIVVRLGEIDQTETLLTHICGQLGLEYQTHEKTINFTETKEEHYIEKKKIYHEINDNETGEKIKSDKVAKVIEIPRTKQIEIQRTETTYEYKIGKYPLKYSLSEYLNKIECILFVDGLDEIHHLIKDSVFEDIKGLSQILKSSKIILTSRYIQEIPSFKQFKISEILPLNEEQKHEIADIWISNPRVFFLKIHKLPYKDLTNRPLFLFYLLRLFENNNEELPKQAVDVYRQIVLLSIREWDDDKELQIRRYSKYKSFDTYKKEDFLSEIAFELTYTQGVKKIFTHQQLEMAYFKVCSGYSELSLNDAKDVVRDIEAHNGLIIELYNNKFEFSHLSIQEYLSAKYILSIPISRKHYELFNKYTAPLAIATVLSPRPEEWFSALFLYHIDEIRLQYQIDSNKIFEYLNRLIVEKVHFSKSTVELGFAMIYLFFKYSKTKALSKLIEFSETRFVKESIHLGSQYYNIERYAGQFHFKINSKIISDMHIKYPEEGVVNIRYIENLIS